MCLWFSNYLSLHVVFPVLPVVPVRLVVLVSFVLCTWCVHGLFSIELCTVETVTDAPLP